MLHCLLHGNELGANLLIEDQFEVDGSCLLKCFMQKFAKKCDIYFYGYDDLFVSKDFVSVRDIFIVDFSRNWLGWEDSDAQTLDFPDLRKAKTPCCIVIDNLFRLIQFKGLGETCRFIRSVKLEPNVKLATVLHADLLNDSTTIKSVEYAFDTVISLSPSNLNDVYATCSTLHKPLDNSIKHATEGIRISDNLEVSIVKAPLNTEIKSLPKSGEPDFQTTFNLKLKDSELEAKNKLVLPYVSSDLEGKGKIEYVPDEFDDFDDEDPDDDLDI